jgi:hypothetical protein
MLAKSPAPAYLRVPRQRTVRCDVLVSDTVAKMVRCGAVRCSAVRCSAVRCCAVLCCAVLCCAVLCGAVRCGAVRCGAVRCGAKRGRDLVTIASKSHVSTSGHAGDHRNQCKCELTSAHNASLLCCTLAALAESVRASGKGGGGRGGGGGGRAAHSRTMLISSKCMNTA